MSSWEISCFSQTQKCPCTRNAQLSNITFCSSIPKSKCFHFREKGCPEGVIWEAGNTPPTLPFNQTPSFICSWPPACRKVSRVGRTYTSYHLFSGGTLCSLQHIATMPLHSPLSTETCHVPLSMAGNSHISVETEQVTELLGDIPTQK